jgi:hypothetical protein
MNPNTRIVTLEVYSSELHDMRARYIMSRNLAICCDIFNRSTITNGVKDIHFENKGLICKQFQNFNGVVLVVNGKFACQEAEDFDLLHNNEWIDTACTMYSTKLFNQIKSIDELSFLRGINLIDNDRYVQVEVDGKVVVVEQRAFGRHEQNMGHILKEKYGNFFQGGVINKFLKVIKKK